MQNDLIILDYQELRRRVEKRLARTTGLFVHVALFLAATVMYYFYVSRTIAPYSDGGTPFTANIYYGYAVASWSVLLLLHGLRTYFRSGAVAGGRDKAIEHEMRERLEKGDSYLTEKDLFRLHGILDNDVSRRTRPLWIVLAYSVVTVLLWLVVWTLISSGDDYITLTTVQYGVSIGALLPVLLGFDFWRRSRHEARLKKLLSSLNVPATEQRDDHENERLMHLSDDGELVDFPSDSFKVKRKNG